MKTLLVDLLPIESDGQGAQVDFLLPPVVATSGAKSASVYVLVHQVDSDTQILVSWAHTTKEPYWVIESTALFDSGTSTGISTGMSAPSSVTDVTRADQVRCSVGIAKTSGGSGQKTALVSVWLVTEPF